MFELKKLCDAYENLTAVEKGLLLTEKSVTVMTKLHCLAIPGMDPVSALAGFLIGSVAADGKVNEQEYLLMYPSLLRVFGDDFDFASVKAAFRRDSEGRKMIAEYTEAMMRVLALLDSDLKNDVIMLCLCVVAIDGKVSLRERNYIRRLVNA